MSGIAAFAGTQAARDFLLVQTDRMRLEGRQTAGIGITEDRRVPRDVSLFCVKQSLEGPDALRRSMPDSLMSGSTGIAQVCSFPSDLVPKDVVTPVFQDRAGHSRRFGNAGLGSDPSPASTSAPRRQKS